LVLFAFVVFGIGGNAKGIFSWALL